MIECTDEYIYYRTFRTRNRNNGKKRLRRFFALILVSAIIGYLFYHINGAVFNLVSEICEDYTYSAALSSINKSVLLSLSDGLKYDDLITVEKNNDGDITLISSDAVKINSISRTIAANTEKLLTEKIKNGIPIPVFAFTGIKLASGFGPEVQYDAITVVGTNCSFGGKFTSVGINQTLHSVYITVTCKIDIEFLYKKRSFDCLSDVLVSEAVLVGKVPEVYLNGALFK